MALGDGDTWDETTPTDATVAVNIDDYNRDLRKGVRGRMALEHEWPDSQSATSEAGRHKYISFQTQAALPDAAIAGTQIAGLYVKTQGLFFVNTASDEVQIVSGTAVGDGKILANATDASADYVDSKIGTSLTVSGTNLQVIAITSTTAVNGYFQMGGGLILEWGSPTSTANSETITFPLEFPSTCYSVIATPNTAAPNAGAADVGVYNLTKSQFDIDHHVGKRPSFWLAIGY